MQLRESSSRAGPSARREVERNEFSGHCASFLSRWSPTKMELRTDYPCTQVELPVRDVFKRLLEVGDSPTWPKFRFAGDSYCFRFSPNNATADTDLQLVRLTSTVTDTVLYRVGFILTENKQVVYQNNSRPLVGSRVLCLPRLAEMRELRRNCTRFDPLTLVLFLHLEERSRAVAGTSGVAQEQRGLADVEKLQCDLRQLLEKETESDARFVVRGREFPVHRAILRTRSAVFEAMFSHDTAEKETGRVVVDDLDPSTFGHFLEYLYSGGIKAGLSVDNVFKLYVAADKYDVPTLRSKCMHHMRRTLSVNSFIDVLTLQQQCHHHEELLQLVTNFFRANLKRIIRTEKWQQFMSAYPVSANELFMRAHMPATQ